MTRRTQKIACRLKPESFDQVSFKAPSYRTPAQLPEQILPHGSRPTTATRWIE